MLLWLFISWALCGQTRRQGLLPCECPFGPACYSQYLTQHLFIYRLIIQIKTLAGDKRHTVNKHTGVVRKTSLDSLGLIVTLVIL